MNPKPPESKTQIEGLDLLGLYVVAEQDVHVAEVEFAGGDDGVGPGFLVAAAGLVEAAMFLETVGRGFNEDHRAFVLRAQIAAAIGINERAFARRFALPLGGAGFEVLARPARVIRVAIDKRTQLDDPTLLVAQDFVGIDLLGGELAAGRGDLEQVAADTGLSISFLSMLERDKVSVSVENLEKLARYFEVHMVHFFSGPEESPVMVTRRESIIQSINSSNPGPAAVTLLSNRSNARIEPLLIHIAPGKEEPHFRKHEADTLVYMLEGQARLISDNGEEIELNQGDLAYYVNLPHRRFANASSSQHLVIILVTAPPTSSLDDLLKTRQGSWVMGEEK